VSLNPTWEAAVVSFKISEGLVSSVTITVADIVGDRSRGKWAESGSGSSRSSGRSCRERVRRRDSSKKKRNG